MLARLAGPALRQARQLLVEHGEVPPEHLVGSLLVRSWRRCLDAGLAPLGRLAEPMVLDPSQLQRASERHCELIAHARPVMEYLHAQTRESGSMVILADDRGILLQTLGEVDFLSRAERVALIRGASWNEAHRGTNAIGTALAEAGAVVIHGAEHYLERNSFLTCAAETVTAPDGRLLGVLDISGDCRGRHPHTLGLVRAAAQMIENRLFDTRHGNDLRLRFHPLAEGIGTVAEGVVALSEDGWVIGANRIGLQLLGLRPADLGRTPISRVVEVRDGDFHHWERLHGGAVMPARDKIGRRLFFRVERERRHRRLIMEPSAQTRDEQPDALVDLDTGDPSLKAAIEKARRVIGKPIPLLLRGESGAGKELFARAFHDSGPRRTKPFVAVNCATLPENLVEAELFGYVPGAFSGAKREGSPGRIRSAHGGTLFLDEIGDMPLTQQARLLRVLQEREVVPVGGVQPVAVDFLLICATHRDLKAEMEAGRFRSDLYYRINGLTLLLPALRGRTDFALLSLRVLRELSPERELALADPVAAAFATYAWPGNLRQLANALRTACALVGEDEEIIGWQHLPDDLVEELRNRPRPKDNGASAPGAGNNLRELSNGVIRKAIDGCRGNLSEAARRLGISRNTLYRRIRAGV
ncbi:MAG TPA: sigma-54-dependent Fis family transcriptional regulator [Accumulibacter sp.]|uniref:sigma-54-dependent Fis family transcriptional regulator n=1 Tax=Accumulibacter sp. TaxID=2053492 RepID=UPI0025CCFE93|nr:sigma-54-dependent Fis family transcriptional regulator [Accumulibacter sp.]MCM8600428.1 sigma-54-dependent Fis family transcriptional regulator [Accumulibacter sp.]MCM8664642.1 sigma-54-dependent Fis family transcriptional regulator [Accumulibacter sp.]HNC52240.1 sigma-54-dependent Fis family transcriptional regulator [Accumulibacter sp.]